MYPGPRKGELFACHRVFACAGRKIQNFVESLQLAEASVALSRNCTCVTPSLQKKSTRMSALYWHLTRNLVVLIVADVSG